MSPLLSPRVRERQPFRPPEDMQTQMERVFQQLLDPAALVSEAAWVPPVDLEETDDAWLIEAELPGVRREDVNVEMQGDEIVIRGEIKDRERKGIVRRRTRRMGQFEFRVRLPGEVDENGIEAKLNNGVLTVRVPKERAQTHRIAVTGGE